MSIFTLALTFFIITNPIGNCPAIISLIKDHSLKDQQRILLRESIFSFLIALFFLFLGETFASSLSIENYALGIGGGILLLVIASKMIFSDFDEHHEGKVKDEPFIVPIASPLISGAGLLTMIMLYSKQEQDDLKIFLALLLAWVGITAVLVNAPYLQVILGKRGMAALEQFMGLVLTLIGVEMIVKGMTLFLSVLAAI